MIRKVLSVVIILSMVMHCGSRLGFLSYLYEKRHDLAYQVGLIAEIPIAMCSGNYDFNKGLVIQQDDAAAHIPGGIPDALEITLFAPAEFFCLTLEQPLPGREPGCHFKLTYHLHPSFDIFHPPLG